MKEPETNEVEVGQVYTGWDKKWLVTRVWATEGVAEIVCVADPAQTARLPVTQFRQLVRD